MDVNWCSELTEKGFSMITRVFGPKELEPLKAALSKVAPDDRVRRRADVYAIRDLFEKCESIRLLADSHKVRALVHQALGLGAFPVRALLFDKVANANWLVPWHQDRTICVREKRETPGYGPWSIKAGQWHVQPPVTVLERMVSVRLHLDDCDESNGALRVIPGTHRSGRMSSAAIESAACQGFFTCSAKAGDVLLMKPLLIHASSAADRAAHRRVVHLDFANCQLHTPLRWRTTGDRSTGDRGAA